MHLSKRVTAIIMAAAMAFMTPAEVFAAEQVQGTGIATAAVSDKTAEEATTVSITEETVETASEPTTAPDTEDEETIAPTATPEESPEQEPEASEEPTAVPEEKEEETAPTEAPEATPTEIPEEVETPTETPEAGDVTPSAFPEEEATETPSVEGTDASVSPSVSPTEPPATPSSTPSASPSSSPEGGMSLEELEKLMEELDREHTGNSYIDVEYDLELPGEVDPNSDSIESVRNSVSIPAAYDARDVKVVSSVKDQGAWGTCWAFSAAACAEAAYMRLNGASDANFSETHITEFFYSSDNELSGPDGGLEGDCTIPKTLSEPQQGGNSYFTTFALASWAGVADESKDSSLVYPENTNDTDDISIDDSLAYMDTMHLENAYWLSTNDADSVKQAILEYGAVGISYYDSYRYSSDNHALYEPDYTGPSVYYNPSITSTNHAVTIIGWDDDFDKENFKHTYANYYNYASSGAYELPSQNGAWLIKNSWGTGIGDAGYFWISYEDASIQGGAVFAFDFANADNYDHNYQYDGSTGLDNISTGSTTTAAAVYKATGAQELGAVGVGFASAENEYTVKIYKNLLDGNDPESGELVSTQKGATSFEGFYTIELDTKVFLGEGDIFSVVIEAKQADGAELFIDSSYSNSNWIEFVANTREGETFYKLVSGWEDAGKDANPFTFRIKAYTRDYQEKEDKIIREDMIQTVADQTYTGSEIMPEPVIIYNESVLVKDQDYTLSYENNINTGTATVTVQGMGEYTGEVKKTFDILPKSITKDMICQTKAAYDGEAYDELAVVYKTSDNLEAAELILEENTDYTVTFSKTPVEAGTYTATVTGMGNYTGSAKATIKITQSGLEEEMVTLSFDTVVYTGNALKPAVTVKHGDAVVAAANYTVKYTGNKNVGTATVTITGKKSLSGSIKKTFTIEPKPLDSEDISVAAADVKYTGKELKPKVTVKDGTKKLSVKKDYTVTYTHNIEAGIGQVTITAVEGGNYTGSNTSETFTISPAAVKSSGIKAELRASGDTKGVLVKVNNQLLDSGDYGVVIREAGTETEVAAEELQIGAKYDVTVTLQNNYSGSAVLKKLQCKAAVESLTVELKTPEKIYTYNGKAQKPAVIVKNGEEVVASKNYTVSYENNINAGTATVVITGKGDFSGINKSVTFEIQPKNLDAAFTITAIKDQTYTGAEITPAVKIKGLKQDKDFTVTYAENVNVAYDENGNIAKLAQVTISLSDNYELTDTSRLKAYFKINPAKISTVKTSNEYYQGENVAVTTTLTVKAGKLSVPEEAYTVTYAGNSKVNKKASVTVTAKAKGNFTGQKKATFQIAKESLAKGTVEGVAEQTYTGEALTQPDLVLKNAAGEVIADSEYTLSYSKNVNAGTATVKIKANADSIYTGTISVKFKILPAELSTILSTSTFSSKTYNGKEQTFSKAELAAAFTEVTTGNKIPSGSYKVSYKNNKNAGTASIVLTGTKNYTGTKTVNFTINPKAIGAVTVNVEKNVDYQAGSLAYPEIYQIADGKTELVKGVDYVVSCFNNDKKGTAVMKITGVGNYMGTKIVYYVIQ